MRKRFLKSSNFRQSFKIFELITFLKKIFQIRAQDRYLDPVKNFWLVTRNHKDILFFIFSLIVFSSYIDVRQRKKVSEYKPLVSRLSAHYLGENEFVSLHDGPCSSATGNILRKECLSGGSQWDMCITSRLWKRILLDEISLLTSNFFFTKISFYYRYFLNIFITQGKRFSSTVRELQTERILYTSNIYLSIKKTLVEALYSD